MNKINKLWLLVALAAAVTIIFLIPRPQADLPALRIGESRLSVEIADTPALQIHGLSGREFLPDNSGMLFKFSGPGQPNFWMKEMRFDLDFIWLADGRVVEITHNVPIEPGVSDTDLKLYAPARPVDSMVEVNSGWANNHNIKVGDSVRLSTP